MTESVVGKIRIRPTGKKLFFGCNQLVRSTYGIFATCEKKEEVFEVSLDISVAKRFYKGMTEVLEAYAQTHGMVYRNRGTWCGSYEYTLSQEHEHIKPARQSVREHVLNLIKQVQGVIIVQGRGELLNRRIRAKRKRYQNG